MAQQKRGIIIRRQILRDIRHHPNDIANHIGQIFNISRQAVNRHLKILVDENRLKAEGSTRNRTYTLGERRDNRTTVNLDCASEHKIYFESFSWVLEGIPKNIEDIVFYGFTEIVNNAIDHSEGNICAITVRRTPEDISIFIADDGEGIFKRIKRLCDLVDERQAIIELSKGKLTTDPKNHTGQGIFFTSRIFDVFQIESKDLEFSHNHDEDYDWLSEIEDEHTVISTAVHMRISLASTRQSKEIFDEYTADKEEDFAFNKTVVPVRLAKIGHEQLVSRSQAKRLLARIENFKIVIFDFTDVEEIGQAFADEIFRVYGIRHPEIRIIESNTTPEVQSMIDRAKKI